jgi:hypothetical protein
MWERKLASDKSDTAVEPLLIHWLNLVSGTNGPLGSL